MSKQQKRSTSEHLVFWSIILSSVAQLLWAVGGAFKARETDSLPVGETQPPSGPQVQQNNPAKNYFSID